MTKEYAPEEIKYRLSNIDDVIGDIALDYITKLEKENAELKERFSKKFDDEWRLNDLYQRLKIDFANAHKCSNIYLEKYLEAKEIIRALLKHTHGQNLNTQNDFDLYLGRIKEAEQFLKE